MGMPIIRDTLNVPLPSEDCTKPLLPDDFTPPACNSIIEVPSQLKITPEIEALVNQWSITALPSNIPDAATTATASPSPVDPNGEGTYYDAVNNYGAVVTSPNNETGIPLRRYEEIPMEPKEEGKIKRIGDDINPNLVDITDEQRRTVEQALARKLKTPEMQGVLSNFMKTLKGAHPGILKIVIKAEVKINEDGSTEVAPEKVHITLFPQSISLTDAEFKKLQRHFSQMTSRTSTGITLEPGKETVMDYEYNLYAD